MYLDASSFSDCMDSSKDVVADKPSPAWFRLSAGLPTDGKLSDMLPPRKEEFSKSQTVPPPTSFVIDQFDHLMADSRTKNLLISLAEQSMRTKQFNMLICVTSWKNAEEILSWNGGEKIYILGDAGLAEWNQDDVKRLIDNHKYFDDWPAESKEQLAVIGAEAGVAGFIVKIARQSISHDKLALQQDIATKLRLDWAAGKQALKLA